MITVSNTSPITNLASIGKLDLLQQLYHTIIIPQVVYDEMAGCYWGIVQIAKTGYECATERSRSCHLQK